MLQFHKRGSLTRAPVILISSLPALLSVTAAICAVTAQVQLDHGPILVLGHLEVWGLIFPDHGGGIPEISLVSAVC